MKCVGVVLLIGKCIIKFLYYLINKSLSSQTLIFQLYNVQLYIVYAEHFKMHCFELLNKADNYYCNLAIGYAFNSGFVFNGEPLKLNFSLISAVGCQSRERSSGHLLVRSWQLLW